MSRIGKAPPRVYVWPESGRPHEWTVAVIALDAVELARYTTKREAEACATRVRRALATKGGA